MRKSTSGFTIVELLIVIVVIGILAAIVIVAYSGVQQRAREAAVRADLANSAKKMAADNVLKGSYELTAAAVDGGNGLPASSGTTYQYHSTGSTYCITGTNSTVSYTISDTAPTPTQGGCPGDGQGGVAPMTNYVLNPSFEDGTMNNGGNISASGGSRTIITSGAPYGSKFMRATFTDVTTLGWGQHSANVPVGTYTASFYVRSDIGIKFLPYLQGTATKSTISSSGMVTVPPNTWVRAWTTINITAAGTIQVGGYFVKDTTTPTTSDYIDFDGFMLVSGSSQMNYADGNSSSWIWNGPANNATSTGPPQ
jgi:prepilin-type N-terminal cleavage/methylation domain-containing protein